MKKLAVFWFLCFNISFIVAQTGTYKKKDRQNGFKNAVGCTNDKLITTLNTKEDFINEAISEINNSVNNCALKAYIQEKNIKKSAVTLTLTIGNKNKIIAIYVKDNQGVEIPVLNDFKDYLQYNSKFYFKLTTIKMFSFDYTFNF
ncbi:MAG: hypothetical protein U0V72_09530 [Cytophagales bacterium]